MHDITSPLRLAVGSHKAGTGKGCAMNVISWENGDKAIVDFPKCSARPLAQLVQAVNDLLCGHRDRDLLCAPCSQTVLALAHATVGTAGTSLEQEAAWTAELLDSPEWGVKRLTTHYPTDLIIGKVADLYRQRASGKEPHYSQWNQTGAEAIFAEGNDAGNVVRYAAKAGLYAANDFDRNGFLATAAGCASEHYEYHGSAGRLAHAQAAISAWHRICGTTPRTVSPEVLAEATRKMLVTTK